MVSRAVMEETMGRLSLLALSATLAFGLAVIPASPSLFTPSAEAAARKGYKKAGVVKKVKVAKKAKAVKVAKKAKPAKAQTAKKGPGACGAYMYWKGGKCQDARAKTA